VLLRSFFSSVLVQAASWTSPPFWSQTTIEGFPVRFFSNSKRKVPLSAFFSFLSAVFGEPVDSPPFPFSGLVRARLEDSPGRSRVFFFFFSPLFSFFAKIDVTTASSPFIPSMPAPSDEGGISFIS